MIEAAYAVSRELVHRRALGRCEGCRLRLAPEAMAFHHRLPRQPRRDDRPSNGLGLCVKCHGWTHQNPKAARSLGWIISRDDLRSPAEIPVWFHDRLVDIPHLLDEYGGITPALLDLPRPSALP